MLLQQLYTSAALKYDSLNLICLYITIACIPMINSDVTVPGVLFALFIAFIYSMLQPVQQSLWQCIQMLHTADVANPNPPICVQHDAVPSVV
jgi:hypothetical protein